MSADISVIPSKKLDYLNTTAVNHVFQELEPMSRRFDTIQPTNAQVNKDSFLYQEAKDYMNLRILKRDVIRFEGSTSAREAGAVGVPNVFNIYNWTVDNFALSKAVNDVKLKWGGSELHENSDVRTPFLTELKSSFLDTDACDRYGQSPLCFDGCGLLGSPTLGSHISQGAYNRESLAGIPYAETANFSCMCYHEFTDTAESTKIIKNAKNNKRIRLMDATDGNAPDGSPFTVRFTRADNNVALDTFYDGNLQGYYPQLSGSAYEDAVNIVAFIEVKEYLMSSFLTTPYSKNKTERMIKLIPNAYLNLSFEYNKDYIANGMVKWVSGPQTTVDSGSASREPSLSRITLESFDVYNPPSNDVHLQFVEWVPERIEAPTVNGVVDDGSNTPGVAVVNQNSNILPQIILLGADPNLWDGTQTSTITSAGLDLCNTNTFFSANIIDPVIKIGQHTITENIPLSEMQRMTVDLINNNQHISELVKGIKGRNRGSNPGLVNEQGGFPFLLLDIQKLSMLSSKYGQLMANVEYPEIQTISISYKIKSQSLHAAGAVTLKFTPQIYKFYPYGIVQRAGHDITKTQLYMSYADSINALQRDYSNSRNVDLDLITGAGFFDNSVKWLRDNGNEILKTVMKGVRLGERLLEDSEYKDSGVHKATKIIDSGMKSIGYGKNKKKGMAIRH